MEKAVPRTDPQEKPIEAVCVPLSMLGGIYAGCCATEPRKKSARFGDYVLAIMCSERPPGPPAAFLCAGCTPYVNDRVLYFA